MADCHYCGAPVKGWTPARAETGRGKYCSRPCAMRARQTRHGHNTRHEGATPTHRTWAHMRQRCGNPNNDKYADYGGRGIKVCERWQSFENFLADMGERPAGTSLDRIDNDGDYTPDNCRWATRKQQTSNTRQTFRVTYRGEEYCLKELADKLGMVAPTLRGRIVAGWPEDEWDSPARVSPKHVSRSGTNALPLSQNTRRYRSKVGSG